MTISQMRFWPTDAGDVPHRLPAPGAPGRTIGHTHHWDRTLGRRRFIQAATVTAGAALGMRLLHPAGMLAAAPAGAEPRPIPGGITVPGLGLFHVFLPGTGAEPSTITDFNGFVGITDVEGMGTATTSSGTKRLRFSADMRFMDGEFVGADSKHHQGTFTFI